MAIVLWALVGRYFLLFYYYFFNSFIESIFYDSGFLKVFFFFLSSQLLENSGVVIIEQVGQIVYQGHSNRADFIYAEIWGPVREGGGSPRATISLETSVRRQINIKKKVRVDKFT